MLHRQRGIFGLSMIPMVVVGLAVAGLGAWAYVQHGNVAKANLARDQAIAERDKAAVARDIAIKAAQDNATTISNLQNDAALTNQALNTLAANQAQNRASAQSRAGIIQGQSGLPANRAVTAPVIAATISAIQADRRARRSAGIQGNTG